MAQTAVILLVLSPVAAAIGVLAYFFVERSRAAGPKPDFGGFIGTVAFWAVGALVLAGVTVSVVLSAFYDPGPFAVFVYGPPALAIGGIAGAVSWRKELRKSR
jgi:hypothetical protein